MARYTGPAWKLSRRPWNLSTKAGTGKELEKTPYAPGPHGPNQRKNFQNTVYNYKRNKKLRHMYGMTERHSVAHLTKQVKCLVSTAKTS